MVFTGQSSKFLDGYIRSFVNGNEITHVIEYRRHRSTNTGFFDHIAQEHNQSHDIAEPRSVWNAELVKTSLITTLFMISCKGPTQDYCEPRKVSILFAGATTDEVQDVHDADKKEDDSAKLSFGYVTYPYAQGDPVCLLDSTG